MRAILGPKRESTAKTNKEIVEVLEGERLSDA